MSKLPDNWRDKTLENLERSNWGEPIYDSFLVRRTHEIRKLPLSELTNDDIAMMLRQGFSLDYIVPLAIDKLLVDVLAYGDAASEGAIMDAMLKISSEFWKSNSDYWLIIKRLLDDNILVWSFERAHFDSSKPW